MEQINQFVQLARSGQFYLTDLCEQFGISRKTGYKWLSRYEALGLKGLAARSHRAHRFPQRTDADVEDLIVSERKLHRTWGPKKLHRVLETKHGIESPPVPSTMAQILRRHGLSVRRRRRSGAYPALNHGLTEPTQPNHVWTVDYKGWFTLGNGQRCDPLPTVGDQQQRATAPDGNAAVLSGIDHGEHGQFGLHVDPAAGYRSHEPPFVFFRRMASSTDWSAKARSFCVSSRLSSS